MELFFFLLLSIILLLFYASTRNNPNAFANLIIGMGLMGMGADLFVNGLILPNTGVSFIGTTASFTSTTYSVANNVWVLALQLMTLIMGFTVFGITIGNIASRRVDVYGRVR